MSSTATPPPLPAPRPKEPRPSPTVLGGLRGIWLFTWRPQVSWRRLPVLLVGLLALPALVYLTTPSRSSSPRRASSLGDPGMQLSRLERQLDHAHASLSPEQREQMTAIFSEEFARMAGPPPEGQSAEAAAAHEREEVKACYDRIHARVQTVLDENQFNRYRNFEKLAVAQSQGES